MIPIAIQAGLWGLLSGSALLLGALAGWFAPLSRRTIAAIMGFGAGVLISALSFELMDEAWQRVDAAGGGFWPVAAGFLGGAVIFTACNFALGLWGARHRKRSTLAHRRKDTDRNASNGGALAIGALLDGIPESIVIGVSLLEGGGVGVVAVVAVFLSNLPEGLSSAAGMKAEGRTAAFVFLLWSGVALIAGLAAWLGYVVFAGADPALIAAVQAVAAGAILAMIVDTMVPEAFEGTHDFAGLIAVAGFLAAFALSKLAG
ncbi:ZIP family zinc transporter [Sphingosinicella sp. LHD-64]|uniref:ZIP family metal transporter n=1 Tax=Sphingosinicella sp. LHD-64 TaxID=3072139 RepID=UPI0028104437|nr:ZIP family zinc transporter [Sphingosinicella sp. LHD-64]MDQ8757905.1 ZIP family zinc transporter [Sphingosinicella sp. LHD-64]